MSLKLTKQHINCIKSLWLSFEEFKNAEKLHKLQPNYLII